MDFANYFAAVARSSKREGREEGRLEGRVEGVSEERERVVRSMLGKKKSVKYISDVCEIPLSTVKDIATKYKVQNTI